MDITSPKYGKKVLKTFFGKSISVYDHSHTSEKEIVVVCYKHPYNAKISYQLDNNKIEFEIEVNDYNVLRSTWNAEDVNESVYEYFMFILNKHKSLRKEFMEYTSVFKEKKWIPRDKKIDSILN